MAAQEKERELLLTNVTPGKHATNLSWMRNIIPPKCSTSVLGGKKDHLAHFPKPVHLATWSPQYHNEQNNNNLVNSDLKLSCFLLPIECWGCRWIRLIVIDKTLLCEKFSPHILQASTENSQVQKIGKYRIQASTEHRQVQTCKYILLYRQVEDILIKYFLWKICWSNILLWKICWSNIYFCTRTLASRFG